MAEAHERIYELGRDALAEQERSVADLRSRVAPLLAGAAVLGTLLARPAVAGTHPDGAGEWICLLGGIGAGGVALICCVGLFGLYRLVFSVDALAQFDLLQQDGLLEDEVRRDLAIAFQMAEFRRTNDHRVRRLRLLLLGALSAFVTEAVLLGAAAALAS